MSLLPQESKPHPREAEALLEMERYCAKHPRSPAAVRRPKLFFRGSSWVALLGYTLQDGIAGIGATGAAALRSFDVQYLNSLKPPAG